MQHANNIVLSSQAYALRLLNADAYHCFRCADMLHCKMGNLLFFFTAAGHVSAVYAHKDNASSPQESCFVVEYNVGNDTDQKPCR